MGILILLGRVCIAMLIIPSREWGFFFCSGFPLICALQQRSEGSRGAACCCGKAEML